MSNKKEKVYINRYGREIRFVLKADKTVTVYGNFGTFYRVANDAESGDIKFFDPEGGPFISVGVSINHYTGWKDSRTIKKIILGKDKITLLF